MKASARATRTSFRNTKREDGDATKARIIEVAGTLFAEHGSPDVTSKEICEAAGLNITAVNYHFGSRDGLQAAVMTAVHDYMANPAFLAEVKESAAEPQKKLTRILSRLVSLIEQEEVWQVKLWVREVISPCSLGTEIMFRKPPPSLRVLPKILADITGRDENDPLIELCLMYVMAPFMFLLLTMHHGASPHRRVLQQGARQVGKELNSLILAGLESAMLKPGTIPFSPN